jgi:hydroxymethylbilane synthase
VIDLRGNVPTRLRKLAEGACDAILLAEAGLVRLGHRMSLPSVVSGVPLLFTPLKEDVFFPAAGQGAIGLEIRKGDKAAAALVAGVLDQATFTRVRAEREFLRLLEGGCSTPVGVYTGLDGDVLRMDARVFPDAGGKPACAGASGSDPMKVARELFDSLA